MTTLTETREYAVRYRAPGTSRPVVVGCEDIDTAEYELDRLHGNGIYDAEIVSRVAPEWSVSRSGLPDTVRALAEAYALHAISEDLVRAKLDGWLSGRSADSAPLWPAWLELTQAVALYLTAVEEELPEVMRLADMRVTTLVADVIGRPA